METDLQARLEVRDAVEGMIKNLGPIVERNPTTLTKAPDFNALLERARGAFPDSAAIREMPKIEDGGVALFDLLAKLSIIAGAVKASFSARSHAAVEEHNRQTRRENREWLGR
jgi:hypothetical protein